MNNFSYIIRQKNKNKKDEQPAIKIKKKVKKLKSEKETTVYEQIDKNQNATTKRHAYRIEPLTTNIFDRLENDDSEGYGDYNSPWKLDSGASDNYAGQQTYIKNRRKVKHE